MTKALIQVVEDDAFAVLRAYFGTIDGGASSGILSRIKEKQVKLASEFYLEDLLHKRLRLVKDLPAAKAGWEGIVMKVYGSHDHRGITVLWQGRGSEDGVKDGFGRNAAFDETQWLAVIER